MKGFVMAMGLGAAAGANGLSLVVKSLSKYPGYTGDLAVSVTTPVVIAFEGETVKLKGALANLEASKVGGFHIHAGATCERAGPHYWEGTFLDPWNVVTWSSDADGKATLDLTAVNYTSAAQKATFGRVVVVHDSKGARVACGKIEPETGVVSLASGTSAPYPGVDSTLTAKGKMGTYLTWTGQAPSGSVELGLDNVLSYDLGDLVPSGTHGIHIHESKTCAEESGPHWYVEGVSDPWTTTLNADAEGKGKGTVNVTELVGAYPFDSNVDHTVVVHHPNGTKIGCAVLARVFQGQGHVIAYAQGNGVVVEGWGEDVQGSNGVMMGAHVHEGTSCASSGGHLLDSNGEDPWLVTEALVTVTEQVDGAERPLRKRAYFKFEVEEFSLKDVANRTFVMHETSGRRATCAELESFIVEQEEDEEPTNTGASGVVASSFLVAALVALVL